MPPPGLGGPPGRGATRGRHFHSLLPFSVTVRILHTDGNAGRRAGGAGGVRSRCRFARLFTHSVSDPRTGSAALFLRQPRDRPLGAGMDMAFISAQASAAAVRAPRPFHAPVCIPHSHLHSALSLAFRTLTCIPRSHLHSALSLAFCTLTRGHAWAFPV
jgi:hypothetical protein